MTNYQLFLSVPLINQHIDALTRYQPAAQTVRYRSGDGDTWTEVCVAEAINQLIIWSADGYVQPVSGVINNYAAGMFIDMNLWPSVGPNCGNMDFPYVHVRIAPKDEVLLLPPHYFFEIPAIRHDFALVLAAARHDMLPRAAPALRAMCNISPLTMESIIKCVTSVLRQQPSATIEAVMESLVSSTPLPPHRESHMSDIWQVANCTDTGKSIRYTWYGTLQQFWTQHKCTCSEMIAMLCYLWTPFSRSGLGTLHAGGARLPLGLLRLSAARGEFDGKVAHLAFDETCQNMPTAFFVIPPRLTTVEPWWQANCHARVLQASCLVDDRQFRIFGNRLNAGLVQMPYASHPSDDGTLAAAWHDAPTAPPSAVLPPIIQTFAKEAPEPQATP
jgi:hypothetical protein